MRQDQPQNLQNENAGLLFEKYSALRWQHQTVKPSVGPHVTVEVTVLGSPSAAAGSERRGLDRTGPPGWTGREG